MQYMLRIKGKASRRQCREQVRDRWRDGETESKQTETEQEQTETEQEQTETEQERKDTMH